ncbi:uncharacterized protein [Halyomorpha halys]|uniref:uncharacterized protein n=1 Tax=Halyomorpha halys TaxID=286706 RepID=UPI0006D50B12|nr:uncharacterized protein LOC106677062 [Halyomorpha halys]
MLAFVVMLLTALSRPILLEGRLALHQFQQLNKVKQDALLALLLRNDKRAKRAEADMSGLPLPIPPRLQPKPFIFVLPATTSGAHNAYIGQLETDKEKMVMTTPVQPEPECKVCPEILDKKSDKMLAANLIMSCCGAPIEPVDPFPNIRKDVKKRVNFGHVFSYKWEKKRQSNGRIPRSIELPRLKIFLLGSKASQKGLPQKLLIHLIR